jgi:hypothetical protein
MMPGRRWLRPLLVLSILAVSAGTAMSAAVPVTVDVAGRSNEFATLAADGEFVALTWAGSKAGAGTNIYAAVSRNGGVTFSAPVRVNSTEGEAQVNGEQPPRVVLVRTAAGSREIVVVWTAKGSAGTRLVTGRSTDDGRTFSKVATVPGSDAPGNRGWESIAAGGSGGVVALWLDHRDTVKAGAAMPAHVHGSGAPMPAAAAGAAADPTAKAQLSQLYFGSLDGTVAPRSIARGVCYCCKTAVLADGDAIYAAWRHVYPGSRRDIAFTVSRDGGRSFAAPLRVSEDHWSLDGCPENGPTLAVDARHRVHVVWPTLVQEKGRSSLRLFHAMSSDGQRFTPRAALPTSGAAYHPQAAIAADGSLLVVWDEVVSGVRQVKFARARLDTGTVRFEARTLTTSAAPGLYPAIATTTAGSLVAWTSRTGDRSRILVLRVP